MVIIFEEDLFSEQGVVLTGKSFKWRDSMLRKRIKFSRKTSEKFQFRRNEFPRMKQHYIVIMIKLGSPLLQGMGKVIDLHLRFIETLVYDESKQASYKANCICRSRRQKKIKQVRS